MIIAKSIKKTQVPFPILQGIGGPSFIGKIKLKNIYQNWRGENFQQIADKHVDNPFNVRIGLPQTDKQLKSDSIFLFTKYLSYNPLTKQIEKRELIPLRNVEKIYIGHSPEEPNYPNARLFVDGQVVVEDIAFKQPNSIESLYTTIRELSDRVQKLEQEILKHRSNTNIVPIYKQ